MIMKKREEYAVFQYRCRRCRELFESGIECSTDNADRCLVDAIHGIKIPERPSVPLLEPHANCITAGGLTGSGVGELCGYRIVEIES